MEIDLFLRCEVNDKGRGKCPRKVVWFMKSLKLKNKKETDFLNAVFFLISYRIVFLKKIAFKEF